MSLELKVIELGEKSFQEIETIQENLSELRAEEKIGDTILIASHPPTLTTGINYEWNIVHVPIESLPKYGIAYYQRKGAGGATILEPGQVVFYPVINLKGVNKSSWTYMRTVEEIVYNVAKGMGANVELGKEFNEAVKRDYSCVWHISKSGKKEKFLAQGYKTSFSNRIITNGGFSVYVDKRAHKNFELIDHCGFNMDKVGVTSFEEMLGFTPSEENIKNKILSELKNKLGYTSIIREDGIQQPILEEYQLMGAAA